MIIDVKTIKLQEYFNHLQDREVLQITFLEDYFQISFDRGGVSCISETFIRNESGTFLIPSKEGNWALFNLIGKKIVSAEEKENEVLLTAEEGTQITINTRLGPVGDTFHITIEGLPTLHL